MGCIGAIISGELRPIWYVCLNNNASLLITLWVTDALELWLSQLK